MSRAFFPMALLLFTAPAFAQNFDVADVKVNRSGEARMAIDIQPGGRVTVRNVPMRVLIVFAYHLRPEALAGGPLWLASERFDIVAKAPETASADEVRRMMQTLLKERFHLEAHTEERPGAAYALTVAKSGPKLQPSQAALLSGQRCAPGDGIPGQKHVECRHVSMALLADYLQEASPADFPVQVVDRTGLDGVYDFRLDWTPGRKASAAPDDQAPPETGPTIFDAVQTQLGLRLDRKTAPLPVVVVDRIERTPWEY
jgi:uncharacterized protein (TIGR03435 family)